MSLVCHVMTVGGQALTRKETLVPTVQPVLNREQPFYPSAG